MGNRGIGESGNRGICKRGNVETASVTVFETFLCEAAANKVCHVVRSLCFHLWASNNKSNKTGFT